MLKRQSANKTPAGRPILKSISPVGIQARKAILNTILNYYNNPAGRPILKTVRTDNTLAGRSILRVTVVHPEKREKRRQILPLLVCSANNNQKNLLQYYFCCTSNTILKVFYSTLKILSFVPK